MSTLRRRWRFTGTVQEWAFAITPAPPHCTFGLTGWVANNWDGSVTLEAQGDRAALDALVPLIERTNRWARIENIETATLPSRSMSTGLRNGAGLNLRAALPNGSAARFLLALTRCYGYNNIMAIPHNSRLTA